VKAFLQYGQYSHELLDYLFLLISSRISQTENFSPLNEHLQCVTLKMMALMTFCIATNVTFVFFVFHFDTLLLVKCECRFIISRIVT
jgi:hypothetical protein